MAFNAQGSALAVLKSSREIFNPENSVNSVRNN